MADVEARGRECGFHGEMQGPVSVYYSFLLSPPFGAEGGRELLGGASKKPNERYHHVSAQQQQQSNQYCRRTLNEHDLSM